MTNPETEASTAARSLPPAAGTTMSILAAIAFCHLLNDMMQSLLPAIYPMLKTSYRLDFGQIGLITLAYQMTASLLQPLVGLYTDRRPHPYALVGGMSFTLVGLLLLSRAGNFSSLLVAASMVGVGSSVFHPESSRVARMASGGRPGLAQSVFQVGGNVGTAVGPLLAAFIVLPFGQSSIAWFSVAALLAIIVLWNVGSWHSAHRSLNITSVVKRAAVNAVKPVVDHVALSRGKVQFALLILMLLLVSKYFYLASIGSYYAFYLINKFHVSVQSSQIHLFVFLGAVAVGTIIGGPIGDRYGRKLVIWCSILGVLPFTLLLPYANLFWTEILSVIIGLVLASAFSAIIVFAQELVPGKVGLISGLFFGAAFGVGGIGAAYLGQLADHTSIYFVYKVCSYLPAAGLLTGFLPNLKHLDVA